MFWFVAARKHFELRAQQDLHPLLSDEGLTMASNNMDQLVSSLGKQRGTSRFKFNLGEFQNAMGRSGVGWGGAHWGLWGTRVHMKGGGGCLKLT